jgi:hypothetical protein
MKKDGMMAIVKRLFRILGVLCLLMGLLWVGQGLGLIHWPQSSFMIDVRPWALRGGLLALFGVGLLAASGRMAR